MLIPLESALRLKFPWRNYQARFLEEFNAHLEDGHLHVVAPPGSGKTVLGLEMIKRVDKKTLVFAPTLTIRNQWRERLVDCFGTNEENVALSFDLKNPAQITFTTYQSLHSFYNNDLKGSDADLIAFFKKVGIQNLVFDEAHHLKNAWWKPLFALKQLPRVTLIALTATPPYDSDARELDNYFDLCGPIDAEISVPELVREGNLCPHQDYIHFSEPDQAEVKYIIKYRERLIAFFHWFSADANVQELVKNHPFYAETTTHEAAIYDRPELYSAMLIYLKSAGTEIPLEKMELLGITDVKTPIPSFGYEWAEILLQYFVIDARLEFPQAEETLHDIGRQLRKIGALDRQRVRLVGDDNLYKSLSQSPSKLRSIVEIVRMESTNLGDSLRLVILCDYIRKEFLNSAPSEIAKINKLGVLPIFQMLRGSNYPERNLAILTGSLIIIHSSIAQELARKTSRDNYSLSQLEGTSFMIVKPTATSSSALVGVITVLFEEGHIKVLIGTKSLLGEGWDCPAINTLLLASFVGSLVMSNQMRGRALRAYPVNPDKVASIWHLACIDPTTRDGGADLDLLKKRFEAFCGVSLKNDPYIENGAGRFALSEKIADIKTLNAGMHDLANQREGVGQRWKKAIDDGNIMVRELKLNFEGRTTYPKQNNIYYKDATALALAELIVVLTVTLPEVFFSNLKTFVTHGFLYFFYAVMGTVGLVLAPKAYKAIKLYLYFGKMDRQLHKMALAVLESLRAKSWLTTPPNSMSLKVEQGKDGSLSCYLVGANTKEESLFVDMLQKVISPVDSPRYLITQSNWFRNKLGFSSYFSVPDALALRKEDAMIFHAAWQRHLGGSQLIFTRNLAGRKVLLKARFNQFNKEEGLKSKTAAIWR